MKRKCDFAFLFVILIFLSLTADNKYSCHTVVTPLAVGISFQANLTIVDDSAHHIPIFILVSKTLQTRVISG